MGGKPKPKSEENNREKEINRTSTQNQLPITQTKKSTNQSSTKANNQAPKMDLGSLLNSVMQNPAIMQMASQIATNQQPTAGSNTGGNPFAGLMGMLGGDKSSNLGIEQEKKKEISQKKTV